MDTSIWVYPWDVIDDPASAREIASLGLGRVSLAASYHSTRALCPHNPHRKFVVASHAATYFPPDPSRYERRRLQPVEATWASCRDSFGRALEALRTEGQKVSAWTVLLHNSRLGESNPDLVVENAFGDRYLYALCPAQIEVREYAAALVSDLVHRYDLDNLELEACGYMGADHLSHHEKVGLHLDLYHQYLLSICFCTACQERIADQGADPERIRFLVRQTVEAFFAGQSHALDEPEAIDEALSSLLTEHERQHLLAARDAISLNLLDTILDALTDVPRPGVILSSGASRYHTGACVGIDPVELAARIDGLLVALFGTSEEMACSQVARLTNAVAGDARVIAGVRAFWPDCASGDDLLIRCRLLAEAGAEGFRFYHYGLCPRPNLSWISRVDQILQELN